MGNRERARAYVERRKQAPPEPCLLCGQPARAGKALCFDRTQRLRSERPSSVQRRVEQPYERRMSP
jgi:hypothetical protein